MGKPGVGKFYDFKFTDNFTFKMKVSTVGLLSRKRLFCALIFFMVREPKKYENLIIPHFPFNYLFWFFYGFE